MKKRVKLLTTIASLCLAVALMAFGVYAATTASFAVTTSVTFSIGDNIAGTVTVSEYNAAKGATAKAGEALDSDTHTFTANETVTNHALTLDNVALTAENPTVVYEVVFTKAEGSKDATIVISNVQIGGKAVDSKLWTVTNNAGVLAIEYIGVASISTNTAVTFTVTLNMAA